MRQSELQGHLDGMLLAVLHERPLHGYGMVEELRRRSGGEFDLPEGTIYPALHRLERAGLLSSRWEVVDGRRRRVYALSRSGRQAVGQRAESWRRFSAAIDAVLTPVLEGN
ncbi:MAG: PadR family transcriptional regulator [Solirubrobacteraceae bacterium]